MEILHFSKIDFHAVDPYFWNFLYFNDYAMKFKVYANVETITVEHDFELGEWNELEIKLLLGKMYVENKPRNPPRQVVTIKDFIQY